MDLRKQDFNLEKLPTNKFSLSTIQSVSQYSLVSSTAIQVITNLSSCWL